MTGVPFGLDIVFLREERVVQIERAKTEARKLYRCGDADMAVELPEGFCEQRGVRPGASVSLSPKA